MNPVKNGTANATSYLVDGEWAYPCRCGVVHAGPYAMYDYGHHNCYHDSELVFLEAPDYLMCPDCGKVFWAAGEVGRG